MRVEISMDKNVLVEYGATIEHIKKGEIIFELGEMPSSFLLVLKGVVRLYTMSEQGKEFTHRLFNENECIGTPPLFINKPYPSAAIAKTDVELLKLGRDKFLSAMDENPQLLKQITERICEILYFKSIMSTEISLHDPEHRIMTLFKQFKEKDMPEEILLTRQQIANLTALRVETVIRTIKQMEQEGKLEIKNRKVYI